MPRTARRSCTARSSASMACTCSAPTYRTMRSRPDGVGGQLRAVEDEVRTGGHEHPVLRRQRLTLGAVDQHDRVARCRARRRTPTCARPGSRRRRDRAGRRTRGRGIIAAPSASAGAHRGGHGAPPASRHPPPAAARRGVATSSEVSRAAARRCRDGVATTPRGARGSACRRDAPDEAEPDRDDADDIDGEHPPRPAVGAGREPVDDGERPHRVGRPVDEAPRSAARCACAAGWSRSARRTGTGRRPRARPGSAGTCDASGTSAAPMPRDVNGSNTAARTWTARKTIESSDTRRCIS